MTIPSSSKPLSRKSYGSIAHLPGSRTGPADHTVNAGQAEIATQKARDRFDRVIVLEKLDGTNVAVARLDGRLVALTRKGYQAATSPFQMHHLFAAWVDDQRDRFLAVLRDGERLCGEWLAQAHGTRYVLPHEPFVAFDLMRGAQRDCYDGLRERAAAGGFITPACLHDGAPISIGAVLLRLGAHGRHGALDLAEGAVWRVERQAPIYGRQGGGTWKVDFLAKYVRPEKQIGMYLPEISGRPAVWNTWPAGYCSDFFV